MADVGGACRPRAARARVPAAAVPPDAGERRVLGSRVHRVDQRDPGRSRRSRGTSSRICPRISASTICGCRKRAPRRPISRAPTASTGSSTTTIGSTAAGCSNGRSTTCSRRGALTSRSACAGRTRTGRAGGTAPKPPCSCGRSIRPPTTSRTSASWRRAFDDPRYIRVDGKPLFLVYRASRLPDPVATTCLWREEALRLGIGELYLCRVESFATEKCDPAALGFDAAVEFAPDWEHLGEPRSSTPRASSTTPTSLRGCSRSRGHRTVAFPGVTPSWDNTARRRHGATVLDQASPDLYEQWLTRAIAQFVP